MPVTVLFDTNILFSATGWRGNPCLKGSRRPNSSGAGKPERFLSDPAFRVVRHVTSTSGVARPQPSQENDSAFSILPSA
jgi:hypothetical protein